MKTQSPAPFTPPIRAVRTRQAASGSTQHEPLEAFAASNPPPRARAPLGNGLVTPNAKNVASSRVMGLTNLRAERYLQSPRGRVLQMQAFGWMAHALGPHPSAAIENAVRAKLLLEAPEAPRGVPEALVRGMVSGAQALASAEKQRVRFGLASPKMSSVLTTKASLQSYHAVCRAELRARLNPKLSVIGHQYLNQFDQRVESAPRL